MPSEVTTVPPKLTPSETKELQQLTSEGVVLTELIPDDIEPARWGKLTEIGFKGLVRAQAAEQAIMPVLGRLLLVAKQNKEMLQAAGYDGFENFLDGYVYPTFHVSRASCYEFMGVVGRWNKLLPSVGDYTAIPRRNFRVLNAAVPKGDEKKSFVRSLIAKAKELTEKEFREHCEEKRYISQGETTGAFLRIPCSKAQLKRFEKFFENPDFQQYVGTSDRADMLDKAVVEATTEWQQAGEQEKEKTLDVSSVAVE